MEHKLQISYSPLPPKFAVVAEAPPYLGFPRTWTRNGSPVVTAFHLHTPKKSANSTSKNFIAVHKRNVRFCAGGDQRWSSLPRQ